MTNEHEERIQLASLDEERLLFGSQDRHRRELSRRYGVEIVSRGGELRILGAESGVRAARRLVDRALGLLRSGGGPIPFAPPQPPSPGAPQDAPQDVMETLLLESAGDDGAARIDGGWNLHLAGGVKPKSPGQQQYVNVMHREVVTIAAGPAGTGKTFLAVARAVDALRHGEFRKLVLARPAVEAGERLGFLPGDLQAKVNPYLRPLYDSLFALMEPTQVRRYIETDVIEIVPLAYMRGRTLERAFIILDEAQNTTPKQMKMFLTRMGFGSKVVVTGDVTQTDLPSGQASGLVHCLRILEGTPGIGVVRLGNTDIVRHPLVQRIVDAYERSEAAGQGSG